MRTLCLAAALSGLVACGGGNKGGSSSGAASTGGNNGGGTTGGNGNGGTTGAANGSSTGSTGANCVLPATIAANMTLDTSCNPWEVTAPGTTVAGSGSTTAVLTIDPGVTVAFDQNASLIIGGGAGQGAISAVGTSSSPIAFKANAASSSPGFWGAVYLGEGTQGTSAIGFATFDSAGGGNGFTGGSSQGALITDSDTSVYTVLLHDLTFTHNGGSGLVMTGWNVGFAAGSGNLTVNDWATGYNPFVVTANQAGTLPATLHVPTGQGGVVDLIDGDGDSEGGGGGAAWVMQTTQTWPAIPIPYLVDGQSPGSGGGACIQGAGTGTALLTIAAPNTLEFLSGGAFTVDCEGKGNANLVANGTAASPIVFTSSGSTSPGTWQGIEFNVLQGGLAGSSLTQATIENAGNSFEIDCSSGAVQAPVFVNGPDTVPASEVAGPTISGCTIENYPADNSGIIAAGISDSQVATYGTANTFTPAAGGDSANAVDGNSC